MPLFTPPAANAVDFALELFTPPASTAVDFDLSELEPPVGPVVDPDEGVTNASGVLTTDLTSDVPDTRILTTASHGATVVGRVTTRPT